MNKILFLCLLLLITSCKSNIRFKLKATNTCMKGTFRIGKYYDFIHLENYDVHDVIAFKKKDILNGKEYIAFGRILGKQGDVVEFKNGVPYRNGKVFVLPKSSLQNYICITKNKLLYDSLSSNYEVLYYSSDTLILNLNTEQALKLSTNENSLLTIHNFAFQRSTNDNIIKFKANWNRDFFGPLLIPRHLDLNDTINIMNTNVLTANDLITDNIYFVIGDNLQDCFDSRYDGYVSKKNILGKLIPR